jgi:isopentenyl phosphate kinase
MPKSLVVIKLGGSALTDKNKIYTPRTPTIHHAASQIAKIGKERQVVLIHGAGSFGHIPVKKYHLANGFKSTRQLRGLAQTKCKLLEWETILDKILISHRVPLIPFLTSDLIVARKGRIAGTELQPLRECLRLGCVPSAGGDIVMDVVSGFSIVSGDQLAAYLAIQLKASSLIFGVDVDGIFDSNPKLNPNARLLETLAPDQALGMVTRREATTHTTVDVTGGMAGKIREAVVAARRGVPVQFVNLMKNSRLVKAALGEPVLGSRIVRGRLLK